MIPKDKIDMMYDRTLDEFRVNDMKFGYLLALPVNDNLIFKTPDEHTSNKVTTITSAHSTDWDSLEPCLHIRFKKHIHGDLYKVIRQTLNRVINNSKENTQDAISVIENLLDAIPPQYPDADWWPDDLFNAVSDARKFVEERD